MIIVVEMGKRVLRPETEQVVLRRGANRRPAVGDSVRVAEGCLEIWIPVEGELIVSALELPAQGWRLVRLDEAVMSLCGSVMAVRRIDGVLVVGLVLTHGEAWDIQ